MKKIGIVGGIGWPSTIEYYRLICEASQRYHSTDKIAGPVPMPEMVIESLDIHVTVTNRGTEDPATWVVWDRYFQSALARLEASGADVLVMASVTPHTRLATLSEAITTPIISVYDSVGAYCQKSGIKNLLLLGTMPTMTTTAFADRLAHWAVSGSYPVDSADINTVVATIDQLYQNKKTGAAEAIQSVVHNSVDSHSTVVCLACTELPLAFETGANLAEFSYNGIRFINAAVIHAEDVFEACITY